MSFVAPGLCASLLCFCALSCSSKSSGQSALGGSVGSPGGAAGDPIFAPDAFAGAPPPVVQVPPDFALGEFGGYKLGGAITSQTPMGAGSTQDAGAGCAVLVGVVRDFKGVNEPNGHPDFEAFAGANVTPNLVANGLGADQKPVYASHCEAMPDAALCPFGQMTTSQANFDEWYRFTNGVNKPYLAYFAFVPNGHVFTFASTAFFPLDNAGWGNSPGQTHNFGFTTELHTAFVYRGGEQFTFTGDDDVWVFVNGKLAIDLGGLHGSTSKTLTLDASAASLGISRGDTYPLDLFHAERHSTASNFRVDTSLAFSNCGTIVPDIR